MKAIDKLIKEYENAIKKADELADNNDLIIIITSCYALILRNLKELKEKQKNETI